VSASTSLAGQVVQSDDNLVNGQTYTFVFQYTDVYANPSGSSLIQPLTDSAPDFIQSPVATQEGTTNYYNIAWTYEGDGSDVVSDVANSMIAAWFSPLGTFEFTLGFGGLLPSYNVSSGAGASGVQYSFSLENLLEPVTPTQQATYQAQAQAQVGSVAASPGGQIATLQPGFNATSTAQAASASNNVAAISSQANTAAALSNTTVLAIIAAVIVGLFFFLRPRYAA
jgi:hypothetical protein